LFTRNKLAEDADLKKRNQEHLRNVTINKGKRED
jgi:hypothetical protein